ncbi:FAD-linked oxidase C-terminal domain-containing protein [Cellulomonas sp. ATA003]|nr:FAD-linked oxidase C-terminal domain-containing protein [Cellulomonas sp. ATA003]WNB85318.1 FAD-linked oxidase C-terminal domain-containing protein [Cellulomonas sp. ATA003]
MSFEALMASHGVDGLAYGHFGDGCVHLRLDIPMERSGDPLRAFMMDAGRLVAAHGGSMSGEHGDGRARGELLPLMYSPDALRMFEGFKHLLDPADVLNPGVVVRPRPLDADLRRPAALPIAADGGFAYRHDGGDFTTAVHRCTGVGKCRADSTATGGFMCPSYLATRDEKDSTRGRARVLQEMANGTLVSRGFRSTEVHEVLDLCLSCKACSSDCPAGVDMAQYKAEVLHRTYRRRLRPMNHYALGWLPRWARLAALAPGVVNGLLGIRPVAKLVLAAGGMDTRRTIPRFGRSFRAGWRRSAGGTTTAATSSATAGGRTAPRTAVAPDVDRSCCGSTPSATRSRPASPRRPPACCAPPGTRSSSRTRARAAG